MWKHCCNVRALQKEIANWMRAESKAVPSSVFGQAVQRSPAFWQLHSEAAAGC